MGKTHDTVRVVNDQIGTPTYTYDLARLLVDRFKQRSMVIIMPQMKVDTSVGMTFAVSSIGSME